MNDEYLYYIAKRPVKNDTLIESSIPEITKVKKDKFPAQFEFKDQNQAEGPFSSLYELKRNSLIFLSIKLQKHKQRILKSKNIIEISDFILTPKDSCYEPAFLKALHHTMVGKISKQNVSGIHFYDTNRTRIIEKIDVDDDGVYTARIKQLNQNTGQWIEKENITTFFPDDWSVHQLFHECSHAFLNKESESGKIYIGKTLSGILIRFVIDDVGKILTFYPEIKNE